MAKSKRAALSNKEMASGYPEAAYGKPPKSARRAKRGRSRR